MTRVRIPALWIEVSTARTVKTDVDRRRRVVCCLQTQKYVARSGCLFYSFPSQFLFLKNVGLRRGSSVAAELSYRLVEHATGWQHVRECFSHAWSAISLCSFLSFSSGRLGEKFPVFTIHHLNTHRKCTIHIFRIFTVATLSYLVPRHLPRLCFFLCIPEY